MSLAGCLSRRWDSVGATDSDFGHSRIGEKPVLDTKNDKGEVRYRLRARSKKVEACAVVEKLCTGCPVSIVTRPASAHALVE
uniref:Transposase n=1 Tax=Panagrellus redivivus TaxID=6233 RepID=A0A7E4UQR9_PANRE